MESVVDPQITAELTQILSNLVLGDNEIRQKCVLSRLFIHDLFFSAYILQQCRKGRQ